MSSKIKVAVAPARDIFALSDDALASVFEDMKTDYNSVTVDAWLQLVRDEIRINSLARRDTLPELMIRRVVELSQLTPFMIIISAQPSAADLAADVEPVMVSFAKRTLVSGASLRWIAPGESVACYGLIAVPKRLYSQSRAEVGMASNRDMMWQVWMHTETKTGGKVSRLAKLLSVEPESKKENKQTNAVVRTKQVIAHTHAYTHAHTHAHANTYPVARIHEMHQWLLACTRVDRLYASLMVPKRVISEVFHGTHALHPYEAPALLKRVSELIGVQFAESRTSQLMTLLLADAMGVASDDVERQRAAVAMLEATSKRRQHATANTRARLEIELANIVQRRVVLRKFGPKRAEELARGIQLSKLELQTVEAEIEKQRIHTEAVVGNKCPHVGLYARWRKAVSKRDSDKLLKDLQEWFGKDKQNTDWVVCKSCKLEIMCKHLLADDLTPWQRGRVCRNCAEELVSEIEVGESIDVSGYRDDTIKQLIYSEATQLVKYVYSTRVDVWKLCGMARDALYEHVAASERMILQSKSSTIDEINLKRHLYTAIWIVAWLAHVILMNPQVLSWEGLKPTIPKKAIIASLEKGLSILLVNKANAIRSIGGMTHELVKNKLIEAFRVVERGKVQIAEETGYDPELFVDPIFNGICNMTALMEKKPLKKVTMALTLELVTVIRKLRTTKVVKAATAKPNVESVWQRVMPPLGDTKLFDKLVAPTAKTAQHQKAYPGLIMASWDLVARAVAIRSHMLASDDAKLLALTEHANAVKHQEDIWRWHRSMSTIIGWSRPALAGTFKYAHGEVGLERLFDESGRGHKWTRVIAGDEMSIADVQKAMSMGTEIKITDYKCAECGVLQSHTHELDRAKVEEAVAAAGMIESFFRFYETRCPKGGLHTRKGVEPCAACRMPVVVPPNEQLAVYRLHKAAYLRDRAEMSSVKVIEPAAAARSVTYDDTMREWRGDFGIVVGLANRLKINKNLLACLGGMEKAVYEEVLSGKFIPVDPELSDRTTTLIEYNRMLYREWSGISMRPGPNTPLGKFAEELRGEKLESIYGDFNEKLDSARVVVKPRVLVEWLLQRICEVCVAILDGPGHKTMREEFVKYILQKMMRSDQLKTKPGYFPWAIIYGDKTQRDEKQEGDDEGDEGGEGDMDDDGGDFDVEEEDQTGEDAANQVRVEGYGLD